MTKHLINYVELAGGNLEETKKFYTALCEWTFLDYGPEYTAIEGAGIDGGFDATIEPNPVTTVILLSDDLDASKQHVIDLGAEITIDTFEFPGGRRFHFQDPAGNHIALWSKI